MKTLFCKNAHAHFDTHFLKDVMARQGPNMQFYTFIYNHYITKEICQTIGELTPIKNFDEDIIHIMTL